LQEQPIFSFFPQLVIPLELRLWYNNPNFELVSLMKPSIVKAQFSNDITLPISMVFWFGVGRGLGSFG
jgi:hypothetical protein